MDILEPGVHQAELSAAVSVWSWMQAGDTPPTVAAAALAFNTTPDLIRAAVADHPWMFLTGAAADATRQYIEHDGE